MLATALMLVWCCLLSAIVALCRYEFCARRQKIGAPGKQPLRLWPVLPSLVVGPLIVVGAYRFFGINLLAPIFLLSGTETMVYASLCPAIVLGLTSGLFLGVSAQVSQEITFWYSKPFAKLHVASGLNVRPLLRRLVVGKSLLDAWQRSLPWLFSELVVVEAVFNLPGLGQDAWNFARTRDIDRFALTIAMLVFIYTLVSRAVLGLHQKLGKKLESYA